MKTIFISSTFRDMNEERDLFHNRIAPELNAIARDFGDSIGFCDLRWGVDTSQLESEEGARKVLSVCLNEIDRCKPHMVVLLGERYGWIPSEELIAQAARSRDIRLDSLEKSVTALEIEYGALTDLSMLDHTLFYFRELDGPAPSDYCAEDPHHAEKLRALKQRIVNVTRGKVKTYRVQWDEETQRITGLNDFCTMVTSDIQQLFITEWEKEKHLTLYQRDQRLQWEFCRQKAAQFTIRHDLVDRYKGILHSGTNRLAIQGPAGIGKSTLLSKLALSLDNDVLPLFCGISPQCTSAMAVVQYLADYLETALGKPHFRDKQHTNPPGIYEWRAQLDSLAAEYDRSSLNPLTIVIDAVDQLSPDKTRDEMLFIPSKTFPRIKIVLSCLDNFPLPQTIKTESVPDLKTTDRISVLRGILAPTGRALSEEVLLAMASKEGGNSPLYLSLLITRLEMMSLEDYILIDRRGGGIGQINKRQIELINACPDDLDGMCAAILDAAAINLESDMPQVAADFLAVSRHGLREQDLCDIFRNLGMSWDSLTFSRFRQYMSRFFVLFEDGRLDFTHKTFRSGLQKRLNDPKFYHKILCSHMEGLPENDPLRKSQLMYHVIWSDYNRFFTDYIYDHFNHYDSIIPVAQMVADRIRKDGGEWICQILRGDPAVLGYPAVHFITADVFSAFSENEDRSALGSVMEQNLTLAKKITLAPPRKPLYTILSSRYSLPMPYWTDYDDRTLKWLHRNAQMCDHGMATGVLGCADPREQRRFNSGFFHAAENDFTRLLALTMDRLAQLETVSNPVKALSLYAQSGKLYQRLAGDAPAEIHNLLLCMNWHIQGVLHEKIGGRGGLDEAERCYRQEIETAKQQDNHLAMEATAHAYHAIAGLYARRNNAHNSTAAEYYQCAIDQWERLLKMPRTTPKAGSQSLLLSGPHSAMMELYLRKSLTQAIQFADFACTESRPKIAQFHKRLVELWDADYRRKPDTKGKQVLCAVYENAAAFHAKSSDPDDIRTALSYYVKSMPLRQELYKECNTAASACAAARLFERASSLYERSGYRNALQMAEKLMDIAVIYRRTLLRRDHSAANRQNLGFSLNRQGLLLSRLGGEDNLRKSLNCYSEALEIRQNLAIELNTDRANDDLIVTLLNISLHPGVPTEQKRMYLQHGLTLSQNLLKKTSNQRYRTFIDRITAHLQKLSG